MTDLEIEQAVTRAGGKWDGSRWVFEDADLHPFARTLLAAERERCARVCESARFTGNTFPRTQMEQLRMDIAAAIRGN